MHTDVQRPYTYLKFFIQYRYLDKGPKNAIRALYENWGLDPNKYTVDYAKNSP